MPRPLIERCQPDNIREFRAAAQRRFDEGLALAASGHRTGAIYLWGYTAEMIVKAAYFSLRALPAMVPIRWMPDIRAAIARGRSLGVAWPQQGEGHNVRAWADLLVMERAATGIPYAPAHFGAVVQAMGQRFERLWRETLRYHKNVAYVYEVAQIRDAAEWFVINMMIL